MYVRPDSQRRRTVVPENYGGVAFTADSEASPFIPPPTDVGSDNGDTLQASSHVSTPVFPVKSSLFGLNGEDLLLLGLIFLLAQSDMANDIVPLLIVLLLC